MKKEYLILLIFILSCKKVEKYYYPSGELLSTVQVNDKGLNHGEMKEMYITGQLKGIGYYINGKKDGTFKLFHESGKIKAIEHFHNGSLVDTSKIYDKQGNLIVSKYVQNGKIFCKTFDINGTLRSEGEIEENFRINWWNNYDLNGSLKSKVQYILLNNEEYINQVYQYDGLGNIVKDSSNFYSINFPDTIKVNKLVKGEIRLNPYLSREEGFYMVYFRYFDLEEKNKANLDSTYGTPDKNALLWAKFKKLGKKRIEGFISEEKRIVSENKKDTSNIDIQIKEHKMFFNKDIFVTK